VLKIRESLGIIGAISPENVYQFASRTRDVEIPVYRDSVSGVIFIDEFYVGDEEYKAGTYRDRDEESPDLEDYNDTQRRTEAFRPFYTGKKVVDYRCGRGSFLRSMKDQHFPRPGWNFGKIFGRLSKKMNSDALKIPVNLWANSTQPLCLMYWSFFSNHYQAFVRLGNYFIPQMVR